MQETVTIDTATAERLYSLFENIEAADAAFKSCQSVQFRAHVSSVYKAHNVASAFEKLQSAINDAKKEG